MKRSGGLDNASSTTSRVGLTLLYADADPRLSTKLHKNKEKKAREDAKNERL